MTGNWIVFCQLLLYCRWLAGRHEGLEVFREEGVLIAELELSELFLVRHAADDPPVLNRMGVG